MGVSPPDIDDGVLPPVDGWAHHIGATAARAVHGNVERQRRFGVLTFTDLLMVAVAPPLSVTVSRTV